ncbi:DNA mismatch repair protein [Nocardia brasiliensis]|uniref:DNA mismatch repair protein n=1 Tax=Nocardia brasiliensis TaxID=37326 RepID=A0A6G9XQL0_NOCBR|nr:DNA mismatch repair protein [Nocardia brasiliensis]QIS03208.1 DNA mismatch repair protein [Nocardia brasiliensis]
MSVGLLEPDSVGPHTVRHGSAVVRDLGLDILFDAMAAGDPFLRDSVESIMMHGSIDPATIEYRQQVLADCLADPGAVRRLYELACAGAGVRRWTIGRGGAPRAKLNLSLEPLAESLDRVRRVRAACAALDLRSAGFARLSALVAARFPDKVLDAVETHIDALRFEHGIALGAGLGVGNKPVDIVLHEPPGPARRGIFGVDRRGRRGFTLPGGDEKGAQYLARLIGRGLAPVADTVSHATDLLAEFFLSLRTELAFYLGCVNLHERLSAAGYPLCFPRPLPLGAPQFRCRELRDPTLVLSSSAPVGGNAIEGARRSLIFVTGANSGGKSTFLRSAGLAQVMLQAGMFVQADSFAADVRAGVCTHFRTEDDATMTYGRLQEELARMREITEVIGPGALLLCNEPFASTNEREGTQIAEPILRALRDAGVKIFCVTHLHDLAREFYDRRGDSELFLRAERLPDGTRTFRLVEGEPAATSHGGDMFGRVFGTDRMPV